MAHHRIVAAVGLLLAAPAAAFVPSVSPARVPVAPRITRISANALDDLKQPEVDLKPANHVTLLKALKGDAKAQIVPCTSDADGCVALCDSKGICEVLAPLSLANRFRVGFYFGVWFLLSIGYSITNKKVTNVLNLPWSVATATVIVGSVFVLILWALGIRTPPKLSKAAILKTFLPIGTFHAIGHIAGTVGTAAGSVSFAQVVKAAGPVYACALSALVLRQAVSLRVWLSLAPIIGGVALATMKELSFAWAALAGAVISDLALALRNVLSKQSMSRPAEERGENMTPGNMFGVLTIMSAIVSVPMALAAEGGQFLSAWAGAAAATPGGGMALAGQIGLTGLYFYGYSEVAMKALNNVHPVTHAIGNTMRRVVIMLVCMVAFRTPMTPLGAVGSAFAVGGSYLYAMTKHHEKVAKQKADEEAANAQLVEKAQHVTPLKTKRISFPREKPWPMRWVKSESAE